MPYQGAKCKRAGYLITVKAFNSTNRLDESLVDYIKKTVTDLEPNPPATTEANPAEYADLLSSALAENLFETFSIPYFEVEVLGQDGTLAGTTKVDDEACKH